ncbi:helicase-exonuclease AddAB subunit AddA [Paenalkalicoccus suaedae]|uniref:ATP-dependent helicase/nuclease subunit A n=1 Tax=Paenalkalicoccus suaedae TaxID=2592382 RepID=A0A859FE71_9BACI|nr:helicase-exonuclease AddAB subunit AddA [Paenalkalicoccus suaedae]QKS71191.1 helicase-exonuclease AddAB subunit AddA [Paenalkalicoccus suaedae]
MTITNIPKPEGSRWTDDQWLAISARDTNILVAAAAGSGKTAVLVERIVSMVEEPQTVDIDELLVVTFTNAAAAEMKARIGAALDKRLANSPGSLHLRRQLNLLQKASISTLHSFCMELLRKHYYELNIDPAFRMLDQTEAQLIQEEVLEELTEHYYGTDESFFAVVDQYSGDRSDDRIKSLISRLYSYSMANANPKEWLQQIAKTYEDVPDTPDKAEWVKIAVTQAKEEMKDARNVLQKGLDMIQYDEGFAKYQDTLEAEFSQATRLLEAESFSQFTEYARQVTFGRMPTIPKKLEVDPELKEKVKQLRDAAKKAVTDVTTPFQLDPAFVLDEMLEMAPSIRVLMESVIEFGQRYAEAKREKQALDFHDLEHFALDLLRENGEPSAVAKSYQRKLKEILVDEYQDTNLVQETILQLLTNGSNMFMVGDVKQSIYRFRLAEPKLFLSKYKRFTYTGSGEGLKIDLSKNFRSRREVLDTTNFIFEQIMDEKLGEMDYDDNASLKIGNMSYPPSADMATELLLIEKDQDEDSEVEDLESAELEARAMAKKINELVQSRFPIFDKQTGATRPIKFRDIVVLMRSMPWADTMIEELKQADIPVYAELATGYFDAIEVRIMLSALKMIDNPYQDIPVASVLRSPMFSFDEEELSAIRLMDKQRAFYEAVLLTSKEESALGDKVQRFLTLLETWRDESRSLSVAELIWRIYEDTYYMDYVGGMPGGKQRQANLRALYDRARAYEETSFRGLFRFLRFIERMQERGDDLGKAKAIGEQEDVVRMMTIHKSKGLEFPVVFVAGLNKQFNMMDLRTDYLLHKEMGFATRRIDTEQRVSYPTLYLDVVKELSKRELLAEEMRILYVALTRAEEKLILLATVSNKEDMVDQWSQNVSEDLLLPNIVRSKAKGFLDWVGPALVRHSAIGASEFQLQMEARIELQSFKRQDLTFETPKKEEKSDMIEKVQQLQALAGFKDVNDAIKQELEWQYAYQTSTEHRAKQSVTELKAALMDESSDDQFIRAFEPTFYERPSFEASTGFSQAEKGTIVHTVMQHISLQPEKIEDEIAMLVAKELLTVEEAATVNVANIRVFLESDLAQRMREAVWMERELAFTYGVPASTIYSDFSQETEEEVFVQGIVDCVFEDASGKLVLLDYKTDQVPTDVDSDVFFLSRYQFQLDIYTKALEESFGREIDETYLYMMNGKQLITKE